MTGRSDIIVEAVMRLIEANAALRKHRKLRALERRLTDAMRLAFLAEERAVLSRFAQLRSRFPTIQEEVKPSDIDAVFSSAAAETASAFQLPLDGLTADALLAGMQSAVAELAVETSFTLQHPDAVDYLRRRGAERVTRIRETTRKTLRGILTQAADEGWSYQRTAKAIKARYRHMAGPVRGVRVKHLRSRAEGIAVYEIGDAYEYGNRIVGKALQDAGLDMQKKWQTVGDKRVRPAHRANQAEGWIAFDQLFSSGHDRPPTDQGCRCTLLQRRAVTEEPTAIAPASVPARTRDPYAAAFDRLPIRVGPAERSVAQNDARRKAFFDSLPEGRIVKKPPLASLTPVTERDALRLAIDGYVHPHGNYAYPTYRRNIEALASGRTVADDVQREIARKIVTLIADGAMQPTLYRGVFSRGDDPPPTLGKVGDIIRIPGTTSFSADADVASGFRAGTIVGGGEHTPKGPNHETTFVVEPGARGFRVDALSDFPQAEVITGGAFEITGVTVEEGTRTHGTPYTHTTYNLRQTAVIDLG